MPKLKLPLDDYENQKLQRTPVQLQTLDTSELKHIKVIADNLSPNIMSTPDGHHPWINSVIVCVCVLTIIVAIYFKYIKKRSLNKKLPQKTIELSEVSEVVETQKISIPSFSILKGEELY